MLLTEWMITIQFIFHYRKGELHITKNTERLRLEGTSAGHLVQPWCSSRATWNWLPRTMSRRLLNFSKDGDTTASPGNLCQCSVTLSVTKCFLMFRGNLPCFSLCPLPLVLSLGTTEQSLAPSSLHPPCRYWCTLMRSPWAFSSPGWTVPAPSASPHRRFIFSFILISEESY